MICRLILIGLAAIFLDGCAANYKGVSVYVQQKSDTQAEDGSYAYNTQQSDKMQVPQHQQGSDTAVPILREVSKLYKAEVDAALDALKECRKLIQSGAEVDCGEIKIPKRPDIPTTPAGPSGGHSPDTPSDPVVSGDSSIGVPAPNASWAGGNLWKPVSDSRGGVAVFLTKASAPHCNDVKLFDGTDPVPAAIEARGRTNSNRETYFLLDKKASELPPNLIVDACSQVFLVPNPRERYE